MKRWIVTIRLCPTYVYGSCCDLLWFDLDSISIKEWAYFLYHYSEILRKESQHAEALYVRGLCLYYQDQTERAFKLFQQVIKRDPDFKKAKDAYKVSKSNL